MAKQINVDLRVNADIKQAKANFESLQKTLFKLQESTRIDVKDESLSKAQRAAGDLARNLQQATNVNTGKLDLNKFSSSLNKSGQDLKKLHQQLSSLGPEGEQAFFKLTQSIATADASTLNLGKKLSSLGVVLKNTARWQLSSSLLHGFMGAISGAYRYAQDLNESLNNIRIVTGQNIDQMSQFAKEANNAAKALSTTTTQYTDASLIYYQQGLSDEDVKRRTDATIKLANVSRQSAEEVSSQMTAIWNNFAKGNENLEYYEDVITKLGATTASSSSEIANGLSKFAAVADTVGLSYEKASAALATVVAETRQSEDIVGTAFKTMFARLEGLNLGETLEDGVDLNKYSKALEAVGVSILDNNGKIKSMNDILDETGAKWQNIGKEQQIALAQTVAGVRQYTQFIALMDNYDKVLKNEAVAKGSAGTVDEQAKTYAESWEAAQKRVTAALETIYKQLLNDNFFIDMLNGAEKFLGIISNVIDGLGGVKGILLLIGSIFMQYYAKEMPRILQSLRDNISVITGASERRAQALLTEAREELELNAAMESRNKQMTAAATTAEVTAKMTEALNKARKGLSQTEIEAYEYEIKLAGAIGQTTEALGKEIDQLEKAGKATANKVKRDIGRKDPIVGEEARTAAYNAKVDAITQYEKDNNANITQIQADKEKVEQIIAERNQKKQQNSEIVERLKSKKENDSENFSKKDQEALTQAQNTINANSTTKYEQKLEELNKQLDKIPQKVKEHQESLQKYLQAFDKYAEQSGKELLKSLEESYKSYGKNSKIIEESQSKFKGLFNSVKEGKKDLSTAKTEMGNYIEKLKEIDTEKAEQLQIALNEIGDDLNFSKVENIITSFDKNLEDADLDIEAITEHLRLLGASDNDLNELSKIWEAAGGNIEEFKAKVQELENKLGEELPQHGMKASEALVQMASAAMQVSMAINTLKNIGSIWSDDDLSTGEKILQTMTAFGTLIPTLVSLYKLFTAEEDKNAFVALKNAAAHIFSTGAKVGETVATEGATAAQWSLNAAMLANPVGAFIIAITALVAILGVLTISILAAANAESEEEKAVRLANEELERSKKVAEEAKQAYEDLKNAVSSYDSAVEALEKCTKGTQEWRDAFREVLEQASNLLTLYPDLLTEKNLFLSDGTLNSDILHSAEERAKNISTNATNNQMLRQVDLAEANTKLKISNFISSELNSKAKELSGLDLDQTVFFKENGDNVSAKTLMKDLVAKITTENAFEDLTLNPEDQNKIVQLTKDFLEKAGIKEGQEGENLNFTNATSLFSEVLQDSIPDIQKLSQETENLATQMQNASNIIFKNYFADKKFTDTNEEIAYQKAFNEQNKKIDKQLEDAKSYGEALAHYENAFWGLDKVAGQNSLIDRKNEGKDTAFEQALAIYAAQHPNSKFMGTKQGENGVVLIKEEGVKEKDWKTLDQVLEEVKPFLQNSARQTIEEEGTSLYNSMDKTKIDAAAYLQVKGNLDEVSYEEVQDSLFKNGKMDFSNIDKKAMADTLHIAEDEVEGYLTKTIKTYTSELNKIPDYLNEHLNTDLINKINLGSLEEVGRLYTNILANSGKAGVQILDDIVKESGKKAPQILEVLANTDFSSQTVDQINASFKDLGINFQLTEGQIYSLRQALVNNFNMSLETAQETAKSISSIISKLKNQGDIIEEEDYQKLLNINPALSTFFTTLADGTHMLTGEIQDFKKATQSSTIGQLYTVKQNQQETASAYNSLSSGVVSSDKLGENKGRFGAWEKYENQTRAQIKILQDNNQEIATELLAQIEEGKNLDDVTYQTAKAYEKLNLSSKEFSEKAEEAAKKVQEITEAIKETQYQFDIQNAGLEYETTENYANVLMELYEAEGLSKDAARALSIANQRLDRGLSSLNDNFEEITKSLKNTNKASAEYAETIGSLRASFADLLNVADGKELSTKWIEKWANNADKMKKILDGDTEAIQEFRESAFTEMTNNVFEEVNESAKNLFDGMTEADGKDVYDALQKLINQLDNGKISAEGLKQELDNIGSTEIGSKAVLSKEYTEALNTMLAQGLLTEQQLNDIFATIGYKPKVTVKDIKQEVNVPIYRTYTQYDKAKTAEKGTATGWDNESIQADTSKVTWTEQIGTKKMVQTVPAVQIVSDEAAGGGEIEVVNAGSMNITPSYNSTTSGKTSDSSKKDSSSSSNPTTKAASHDHEVNRYSNEENAIKGLSEQYDRLNKVKDKAFGKSRIQAIEAEIKHLKALKEASGDYLDAIVGKGNADKMAKAIFKGENIGQMIANGSLGGTARADYNSLFDGLSASGKGVEYSAKDSNGNEWLVSDNYSLSGFNSLFGTNLQFNLDSYGNIQNKDAIYNLLQNLKNNENDAYSRIADPTAGSTTEYNKRMAYLEAIKERVDQFEETVDLMSEKTDEYIDYIASIQEKNAELITTKMEHGVNLGQKTIQRLERAIKILGDNIYKTAEAMTTWYNATLKEGVEANKQQGEAYAQAFTEAAEKIRLYDQKDGYFNENAIDPASAAELLSSIEDGYDSLIDDLLNRIEEGKTYYGNVLDYWNNKLDKVNSAIQTNAQLLEHFQTVLNLLGRSADYEAIGIVLQGQLENAQSDYASKKAQTDVAKQAYERTIQGRESLIAQGISAEALEQYEEDVLHKALENYQAKADAMYSALEHYIETANAKFENEINRAFAESEDRLTGEWGSFDALDSAMQRQRSVSNEYLTKTNQLYESNILLRKLSQDIDKTDSRIAKGKLKAFADEIEAMKAQEKLSKTDLEIAKARYELLQAEIALEDARNAKSTVRLKRDNEGNYGYVYTADQDAVNDAEQNLADKQNNLYNLVLSQTQEYGEKMIQLRKEHDAEIRALEDAYYKEGIISREEFEMQLQDIEKKYQELEYAEMQSYETAKLWLNRTGAEGQTEAWTNSFDEIITQHRLFNNESENNMTELSNNVISNLDELDSQREYFTKEAKMGNEELKQSVNEITRSTDELSKKVAGKNMNTAMITAQNLATAFSSQYDTLRSLITQYGRAADEANALYRETVNLINAQTALNIAKDGAKSVSWNTDGTLGAYGNNFTDTGSGGSSSGGNTPAFSQNSQETAKNPKVVKSFDQCDDYYHWVNWSDGTREKKTHVMGRDNSNECIHCHYKVKWKIVGTSDAGIVQIQHPRTGEKKWVSNTSAMKQQYGFKSGGYTGSWNGPDLEKNGKLAFLHQKELVLNADDTENMLSAVKLIRQISQTIDLQAISQAAGLQMAPMKYNIDGQTLQQDIAIHAEFPNVSDHNEIEEALSNLVNRATQFAHRS